MDKIAQDILRRKSREGEIENIHTFATFSEANNVRNAEAQANSDYE